MMNLEVANNIHNLQEEIASLRFLVDELFQQIQMAQKQATKDDLTGLLRRGVIENKIGELMVKEPKNSFVVMVDVDNFKAINDNFGHPTGDKILQIVAGALESCLQEGEWAGRYGGEEFILVTPFGLDRAIQLAEQARQEVTNASRAFHQDPVTISLGVGPANDIPKADQNLYEAKRLGKNRVVGGMP